MVKEHLILVCPFGLSLTFFLCLHVIINEPVVTHMTSPKNKIVHEYINNFKAIPHIINAQRLIFLILIINVKKKENNQNNSLWLNSGRGKGFRQLLDK